MAGWFNRVMLSDFLLLAPAAIVFATLIILRWRQSPEEDEPSFDDGPPANAIVVDGSNVMHWSGKPSLNVLAAVLRVARDKGYEPIVFFDANVGYKVGERYYDELALAPLIGVRFDHICVVDSGVVADESLLMFARDHRCRVITNDRFRDWRGKFPHLAKKDALVRGHWRSGNPVLHRLKTSQFADTA